MIPNTHGIIDAHTKPELQSYSSANSKNAIAMGHTWLWRAMLGIPLPEVRLNHVIKERRKK